MVKKFISITLLSAFLALASANVSAADISAFPGAAVTESENNTFTVNVTSDAFFSEMLALPANSTTVINGNGHKITRATGYTDSFLSVPAGATLTINDLTLDGNAPEWSADTDNPSFFNENSRTYGQYTTSRGANDIVATAPIIVNAGQLTVNNFTIQNALSNSTAGIRSTGSLTANTSTFAHNLSYQSHGGAVSSANGELTITNSTFRENGAGDKNNHWRDGGALYLMSGHATIDGSTFADNFTLRSGGAILIENANADISSSIFRGNMAGNDGSAILMWGSYTRSGVVNYKNNKFIENRTFTYGVNNGNGEGTICTYGRGFGTVTFDGDEFTDNFASWGSVMSIYDEYSPTTLKNLSIKNVKTTGNKDTRNSSSYLEIANIENVTIDNYTSENDSGEVYIFNGRVANITDVKTTGSLYVIYVDNVTAEGIEVNAAEETSPYFVINSSESATMKDFTAKTHISNSLPGIYNVGAAELENIDTEGLIRVGNVSNVIAETLSASGTATDSISFETIGNLTAKNITLKDFASENSAISLYDVTKADLENVSVENISGSGYSLFELTNVGEVNVKNLTVDGNTNTNADNSIIKISDEDGATLPENRSITFENAKITNNRSAGLGGGLMILSRSLPITFDENSIIINNESEAGGDDVYIAATDGEPQLITLPNVIWEDEQEEEAIILGSIVIDDTGAHYLKVTTIAENPATGDDIHYEFIIIGCAMLAAGAYLIRTRRSYRR